MSDANSTSTGPEDGADTISKKRGLFKWLLHLFDKEKMDPAARGLLNEIDTEEGTKPVWLLWGALAGMFFAFTQTGRSGVDAGYQFVNRELQRFLDFTKRIAVFTVWCVLPGAFSYVFWLLMATWLQFDPSFWLFWSGILVALGWTVFFTYLVVIQSIIRLLKVQEDLSTIDTKTPEGKRLKEERRAARFALAGAFSKSILWCCLYILFGMLLRPWEHLLTFVIFNLSLFVTLLTKDSSQRGREGKWTIGHLMEAVQIGSIAAVCIFLTIHYWNVGLRRAGGPQVAKVLDALADVGIVTSDQVLGWAPVKRQVDSLKVVRSKAEDRNKDGFVDALDTAFAVMDIDGRGGMPNLADLRAFPLYFRSTADTTISELGDGTMDTTIVRGPREWTLHATVGPYKQPVGDFNGDFHVNMEDSLDFANYLLMGGHPPIYQTDPDMIPAGDRPLTSEPPKKDTLVLYGSLEKPEARYPSADVRDRADRIRQLAERQVEGEQQRAVVVPSVSEVPMAYSPQTVNYNVDAKNPEPLSIGRFPSGSVIHILATGKIRYDNLLAQRFTIGPIGDPEQGPVWKANVAGEDLPIWHGALCIVVPPDKSIKGFVPPSQHMPLNWIRDGGGVWIADFPVSIDGEYELVVADGGYGDNDGYYVATVKWSRQSS